MEKKIFNRKVSTDQATEIVNLMFSRLTPTQRNKILNIIDDFVINDLGIPEGDVPWLNKSKKNVEDYIHILDLMRLAYARLFNNAETKFKKNIH